ncbi:MAG: hypothetical protein R3332_05065 [Pseudohongiellaceae bacterium]|nr:hypothetical protein [Pseudohongiellaceae bacterium]
MKSHQWENIGDVSKDFFDSVGYSDSEAEIEEASEKRLNKRRLTELRRRAEERLDWKRMSKEMDFDDDSDDDEYFRRYDVASFDDLDDYDDL